MLQIKASKYGIWLRDKAQFDNWLGKIEIIKKGIPAFFTDHSGIYFL